MRIGVGILFFIATCCAGCALPLPGLLPSGGGQQQQLQHMTNVELAGQNYRIVKTNVVGSDWGINLLGVLPIISPDYTKAMSQLYKEGDIGEGKALAVANLLQQHTAPFFILFSIPKITFRADLVEFTGKTVSGTVP